MCGLPRQHQASAVLAQDLWSGKYLLQNLCSGIYLMQNLFVGHIFVSTSFLGIYLLQNFVGHIFVAKYARSVKSKICCQIRIWFGKRE